MTPTDQEFIHAPEQGLIGDCQRAVIASLLDLPIAEVPHFMKEANGDTTKYWELLQSFVRSHGFAWLVVPARSGGGFFGDDGDVYHEISGPSPRGNGITHAVVGCNGEIVFDPHPSRAGLAGDSSEWEYAYLVRVATSPPAPSMQSGNKLVPAVPELSSTPVNDACWSFVEAMPHTLPRPIWNDLKPAIYAAIAEFINSTPSAGLTDAARDVPAERQRQIDVEGYTPKFDDRHRPGELASAAACYVLNAATWLRHPTASRVDYVGLSPINWTNWPWDEEGWKPKNERQDLVRAGALILAEIERMDRAHGINTPVVQAEKPPPIVGEILAELERATRKFPTWPTDPLHALAVLGEEFGETTKAMLQLTYEPHKTSAADVRTEAIQTAAMALRLAMSLERYLYAPSAQHSQQDGITAITRG